MKVFGLTGGVGMGKSTAGVSLQQCGAALVDTDDLAHELVLPGQPALAEILAVFGAEVALPDGRLSREKLAQIVFSDPKARHKLEAILHPRIRNRWKQQVEVWRTEGRALAVIVIPLLYETGAETELDAVICIACSRQTQDQRLAGRGWTPEHIQNRRAAQLPIEEKMARANYVAWNESSPQVLARQLARIVGFAEKSIS